MHTRNSGRSSPLHFNPEISRSLFGRSKRPIVIEDTEDSENLSQALVIYQPLKTEVEDHTTTMGDNRRTMGDFARPSLEGTRSCIMKPTVEAENFELKTHVIQMVQNSAQFDGMPDSDANTHITSFIHICDTFKIAGVTEDAIRLRLFPFSLRGHAKRWFTSLPAASIITWEDLAHKFLAKYFPPAKTNMLINEILSFEAEECESLYEAWERYRELLQKCPHHELPLWRQVQTFFNGLDSHTQQSIHAAAGGSMRSKTPQESYDLIDEMAMNGNPIHSTQHRNGRGKQVRFEAVNQTGTVLNEVLSQMQKLTTEVNQLKSKPQSNVKSVCVLCKGSHMTKDCKKGSMFDEDEDHIEEVFYSYGDEYDLKADNRNDFKPPMQRNVYNNQGSNDRWKNNNSNSSWRNNNNNFNSNSNWRSNNNNYNNGGQSLNPNRGQMNPETAQDSSVDKILTGMKEMKNQMMEMMKEGFNRTDVNSKSIAALEVL